jgi:hypothetical protein
MQWDANTWVLYDEMTMHTPQSEHTAFDAICAEIEDFEPLPTITTEPPAPEPEHEPSRHERASPIDEQILAGLVSV